MKTRAFIISFILVQLLNLNAQIGINWQKCLGGSSEEEATSIQQTIDGGYIITGSTWSNDEDVSGNHGQTDFWVVKISDLGYLLWQKCLGGTLSDHANSIQQTADGGYILAGSTYSDDGDVSGNHGTDDYWVVKLDEFGNIQWQKCLGGTDYDQPKSIKQTFDSGYIICGYSNSNNGDVSGNHGNSDYWIVKLNKFGFLQWQKCLGGSNLDEATSIAQTIDSGYIVTGYSESINGDITNNHGGRDFWVIKLNVFGNIQWQKCLGGSSWDCANDIQETFDGGYIVTGATGSNDGDVSGNHGDSDYWVVKLNEIGSIQWQNCFGGSSHDSALCIRQSIDSGFIVTGISYSNDGDVSGNHGNGDYWVVKMDKLGVMEWNKCLGGTSYDLAKSIQQTLDDSFIIAGLTHSNNGNVSGNHGARDFWVVKLCVGDTLSIEIPNPNNYCYYTLNASDGFESYLWNTGDTTQSINIFSGGTYNVVGTNEFGCSIEALINAPDPPPIPLSIEIPNPNNYCYNTLVALDGFDNYLWNTGETTQSIDIFEGGLYSVTGTNDLGCSSDAEISASDPPPIPLSIEIPNPNNYCYNTLVASDGFNNYLWNTGETSQSIDIITGGIYSVTGTNELGCSSEADINASNPIPIPLSIEIPNPNYCYTTELMAIGEFNSFLWSNGETTQTITISIGGSYTVTGYADLGCQSVANTYAPFPLEPFDQSQICMVTLDEENEKNIVVYEPDLGVGIDSVLIYRLNNTSSEYEWIGSNSLNEPGIYIDQEANPVQQSYQYKISIKDTCEKISELSPKHQTILLQANVGINNETNLFWNPYVGFDYPNFGIYRSIGNQEYFLIANVPNNIYSFTDTNPPYSGKKYQIRVEKSEPCNPEKSYSYVSSNPVILETVGVSNKDNDSFKVYPNPFDDIITIKRTKANEEVNIEMINTYGTVLNSYLIHSGIESITISTRHLNSGIYFLRINGIIGQRIVK
jgi:hypothetical protein